MEVSNADVVPHNLSILKKFRCHVNVEIVCQVFVLAYLLKYVNKNSKKGHVEVRIGKNEQETLVNNFFAGHILGAAEAADSLLYHSRMMRYPSVLRISLSKDFFRMKHDDEDVEADGNDYASMSQLQRYFCRPKGEPFASMTIRMYYADFQLKSQPRKSLTPWEESFAQHYGLQDMLDLRMQDNGIPSMFVFCRLERRVTYIVPAGFQNSTGH